MSLMQAWKTLSVVTGWEGCQDFGVTSRASLQDSRLNSTGASFNVFILQIILRMSSFYGIYSSLYIDWFHDLGYCPSDLSS